MRTLVHHSPITLSNGLHYLFYLSFIIHSLFIQLYCVKSVRNTELFLARIWTFFAQFYFLNFSGVRKEIVGKSVWFISQISRKRRRSHNIWLWLWLYDVTANSYHFLNLALKSEKPKQIYKYDLQHSAFLIKK